MRNETSLEAVTNHTIETPATNLVASDHIFDEENSSTESKRQFVEEFQVFEKIVVGSARIRVLVVVTIDQQFHYRFGRSVYENCFLFSRSYQLTEDVKNFRYLSIFRSSLTGTLQIGSAEDGSLHRDSCSSQASINSCIK